MYLAICTAGDEASVALGTPGEVLAAGELEGRREHARGLLPLIDRLIAKHGGVGGLDGVLVADGPGSFTGLRIGAAVAKALVHAGSLEMWSAPSLLIQAAAKPLDFSGRVLALSDALRGEVYAGAYRFAGGSIEIDLVPGVFRPDELVDSFPKPDLIVSQLPHDRLAAFGKWDGPGPPIVDGIPSARILLELLARPGGVVRIPSQEVAGWEPDYGRPAEAQAIWERTHGRSLEHPGNRA